MRAFTGAVADRKGRLEMADHSTLFLDGRFLRDLLYRIEVINIKLPPLRERRDDIYLLVQHFIRRYATKYEKKILGIEADAMQALADYDWPGNIRELKNFIARGVILSKRKKLGIWKRS